MQQKMGIAGRMAAMFQANRLTPLLALALFLAGLFALFVTPREEEPQIDVTMASILYAWPGASAAQVEAQLATPAERVLARMDGIDHVLSVASPGMAVLTVQFKVGIKRQQALLVLHDTLRTGFDWLRAYPGVQEPVVRPRAVDDVPIMALTLHARDADSHGLLQVARSMESDLKRVSGIRDVWIIGGDAHSLQINLDVAAMARTGITLQDVHQTLADAGSRVSAGQWLQGDRSVPVEAGSRLQQNNDLAQLRVGQSAGKSVMLGEIASWYLGASTAPDNYVSFRSQNGTEQPQAAVTLAITKKPGENAIAVARAVQDRVAVLRNTVVPAEVSVAETRNYGITADDKARSLIFKLLFATLSVVLLVLFALGRREALIVGLAVGLTLAATLFASWAWGFTLNRVSLFALIFSIGILVDDAIVVVENIHRHARLHPDISLLQRIPQAVDEVGGPTILATFTVIAALLPMAFVSGLMGPYMSPIPINASMGMLISLLVALSFTPWLAHLWSAPVAAQSQDVRPSRGLAWSARVLGPFVRGARAGRHRLVLALLTLFLVLASALMPVIGWVELKMLPFDNKSEFQVLLRMPADTTLERTNAVLQELGDHLLAQEEVLNLQTYAGSAAPINFNGLVRQYDLRRDPTLGDIQVNLLDKSERSSQSHDIAMRIRPALQAIAAKHQAHLQVVEVPPGPPVLAPIVAEIYGPDAAGRQELARQLREIFSQTSGMVDIDDSGIESTARLVLTPDRERIAQAGASQQALVQALQAGLSGMTVAYLDDDHSHPTPVVLRLPPERQGELETLLQLPVRSMSGQAIAAGELLNVVHDLREQPSYHKDLLPVHYVTADMAGDIDSPLYGMFASRSRLAELRAPDGGRIQEYFVEPPDDAYRGYSIKWDGEWKITYETFRDMGLAYAVGLLLIYLLVVAHFGSYLMPLIIMAPIPLTIVGVMPGHALLDKQFTATSMIGMIALAGIIVRNSILLVDFVRLRLRDGVDLAQAVIESAAIRARPILLTGLAAMLGAFFILDDPIFNGLAIALIFGIAVSTALTLVIIPLMLFGAYRKRPLALLSHVSGESS